MIQCPKCSAEKQLERRFCHGKLFFVPHSAMAQWAREAEKVVLIDGCLLRCHGPILKNIVDEDSVFEFDALSVYKKYMDIFDIDAVPEDRVQGRSQTGSGFRADCFEISLICPFVIYTRTI